MSWLFPFLRQSDPRWARDQLGDGPGTIGTHGCTLTALCQAARALGVDDLTPDVLNARGRATGGFVRDSARIPLLAQQAGLQAPTGLRVEAVAGVSAMVDVLHKALEAGWVALLRVDRTPGPEVHWHWVLALAERQGMAICADPATGRTAHISLSDLKGTSEWPSGLRSYEVDAVVPVGPAKQKLAA